MAPTGKTALITGASAGLGLEFARLFAADGNDVALVARRKEKLQELADSLEKEHGIKAHVFAADLGDPAAPAKLYEQVQAAGIVVEYLVNNAGLGTNGAFWEIDVARDLQLIQVNVNALVHLTRLFLPAMIARKSGRILNIGSTAAFTAGPFMASYYASKAFVVSFTEALAFELKGTGVTATCSCPGATATEFAGIAGNDKSTLFQSGVATATPVAQHGYRAMMAGKVTSVVGAKNKFLVTSMKMSPRVLVRGIAAKLNRPPV